MADLEHAREEPTTTSKADAPVVGRTAPLTPEELVLLGYYRMAVERGGTEAGDRFVDALNAELARLDADRARRQRPRPTLAFSDQAVRS